ncbi:hypothetical protein B0T25DRAFT_456971 [Lasiosphaeria hispida]|uniref:NADH dehydrogenase [ubiquinone] 1 alpha subcomplex subunit 1 n=1 Tax=Lasiosphaeria hispida TaxID=260671 RepID=A0AAJ0HFX1_9PEZI|nr:hypothetical protein B0T25DRAFT_456971 [Lasiosphaeria hispida]
MPIPFETLIPYGIIVAMFGVTGAGLSKIRNMQNGGKRQRRGIDQWDRVMMDRDRRMTGWLRGQADEPVAPAGYELNNPWRVCTSTNRVPLTKTDVGTFRLKNGSPESTFWGGAACESTNSTLRMLYLVGGIPVSAIPQG